MRARARAQPVETAVMGKAGPKAGPGRPEGGGFSQPTESTARERKYGEADGMGVAA